MNERIGGSKTVVNGQIVDVVGPPTTHPEGNCSRDAQGRRRDAAAPAPQPAIEPPPRKKYARGDAAAE